jgi:hypothetical protein
MSFLYWAVKKLIFIVKILKGISELLYNQPYDRRFNKLNITQILLNTSQIVNFLYFSC